MQAWLVSGDAIWVAEAQSYFEAVARMSSTYGLTNATEQEPPADCLIEEMLMPGGFGRAQSKRRGGKTGSQAIRRLQIASPHPTLEPQPEAKPDLVMQAEIEISLAHAQQHYPEEMALAWSTGVYNPLAHVDLLAVGARFLEPEEEDWLAIARILGWLEVEEEMDAIYFTAPPPDFALAQADWYVRPDLTTILEAPVLLREVIHQYPISVQEKQRGAAQLFHRLGWTTRQQAQFIQDLFEKPQTELDEVDWLFLLLELACQLGDRA